MKIFVQVGTGYCGETATDIIEVEDQDTDEREGLDQMVYEMAIENAQSYGREIIFDSEEIPEDEDTDYIEEYNLEYSWEVYVPSKHNMLIGGGTHPLMETE